MLSSNPLFTDKLGMLGVGSSNIREKGVYILISFLLVSFLAIRVIADPQDIKASFFLLVALEWAPIFILVVLKRLHFVLFFCFGQFLFYSFPILIEYFSLNIISQYRLSEIQEMVICNLIILSTLVLFSSVLTDNSTEKPSFIRTSTLMKVIITLVVISYPFWISQFIPVTFFRLGGELYFFFLVFCFSFESGSRSFNFMLSALVFLGTVSGSLDSGFMSLLYLIGIYIFFVFLIRGKKIACFLSVLMGLSFFFFQPVKNSYRQAVWSAPDLGILDRIQIFSQLMSSFYGGAGQAGAEALSEYGISSEQLESALQSGYIDRVREVAGENDLEDLDQNVSSVAAAVLTSSGRLGDDSLRKTLEKSGTEVPFFEGKTYENLLFSFIPRFLWPDKPQWLLGGEFGHLFGYLNEDDGFTSIAFNFLAEGYMNFGYAGLYGVSVIYALLLFFSNFLAKKVWGAFSFPIFFLIGSSFFTFNVDMLGLFQNLELSLLFALLTKYLFERPKIKNDEVDAS